MRLKSVSLTSLWKKLVPPRIRHCAEVATARAGVTALLVSIVPSTIFLALLIARLQEYFLF